MKKIMLGLLIVGCSSSYAADASKNYEAKYTNEDGSQSILRPKFSDSGTNGSLHISNASDFDGLCKRYGFAKHMLHSIETTKILSGSVARIDSESEFSRIDEFGDYDYVAAVTSISCKTKTLASTALKSQNFEKSSKNADNTTTIFRPRFKMNGRNFNLSTKSDLDGVCKLYGHKSYVSIESSKLRLDEANISVDSNAAFYGFYTYSPYYGDIESIICK